MVCLIYVLNAEIAKRPSILGQLEEWLRELREAASAIARKFGASALTIGVQLPLGLYVEVSFDGS